MLWKAALEVALLWMSSGRWGQYTVTVEDICEYLNPTPAHSLWGSALGHHLGQPLSRWWSCGVSVSPLQAGGQQSSFQCLELSGAVIASTSKQVKNWLSCSASEAPPLLMPLVLFCLVIWRIPCHTWQGSELLKKALNFLFAGCFSVPESLLRVCSGGPTLLHFTRSESSVACL